MGIYHKKGERPHVIACSVFGGRSPKTGQRVGSRHRWSEGGGKGRCEFCHKTRDDVMSQLAPDAEKAGNPAT